jgi:hypothetical protein
MDKHGKNSVIIHFSSQIQQVHILTSKSYIFCYYTVIQLIDGEVVEWVTKKKSIKQCKLWNSVGISWTLFQMQL